MTHQALAAGRCRPATACGLRRMDGERWRYPARARYRQRPNGRAVMSGTSFSDILYEPSRVARVSRMLSGKIAK
jgi:hypothetical protein